MRVCVYVLLADSIRIRNFVIGAATLLFFFSKNVVVENSTIYLFIFKLLNVGYAMCSACMT